MLRIKVSVAEFIVACSGGCVYGKVIRQRGLYVYAELGQEREYNPTSRDNSNTEYRVFTGCDAYFAKTSEQLRSGDFEAEYLPNVTVIIYQ